MTDHQHTAETLNRAANLIEERGWLGLIKPPGASAWDYRDEGGPICMEGGILAAVGKPRWHSEIINNCPAGRAVRDYLGRDAPLWMWNDAPNRTASEVIEVLRAAAVIEQAKADGAELTIYDDGSAVLTFDTAAEMKAVNAAMLGVGPDVASEWSA